VSYDTSNNTWTTQRYYPYGSTRSGEAPTDWLFTGQRFDGTIGLYDYGARFYDPALGRFISADAIVPEPGNPQALNRYSYVLNNPLRYVDPAGRFACIPGTGGWEGPQKYNIHACAYRLGYGNKAQVKYKQQMMTVAESEAIPSILLAAAILRQTDPAWPDRFVGDEPERFLLTQARSGGVSGWLFGSKKNMSVGIGQITPSEAERFGWSGNLDDLFDPEQSIGFMGAKIAQADAFIQTQAGWTELDRFMLLAIAQNSGKGPTEEFYGDFVERDWAKFLFDTTEGRNPQRLRDQLWAMLMRIEWLLFEGDWSLPPGIDLQEYRQRLYPGSSGG
jgi:RHS repeat-associated protein